MRILFLGGNLAFELAEWLKVQGDDVVYTEQKVDLNMVKEHKPDMIISYNYKYLLTSEIIKYPEYGCINLHISLLPWNRGYHPNVWSFLEDTPKGVTIHHIDGGIDTGNIIIQKEIFIDENKETLQSSYEILHKEIQTLFKENWNKIRNRKINPITQAGGGVSTTVEGVSDSSLLSKIKGGISLLENLKKNIDIGDVTLKNFINFTAEEREMILTWRCHKNVRRWMYSDHIISPGEHSKFMDGLKEDKKNLYWLVEHKKKGCLGVVSLNRVDFNNKNAYLGIYNNPELSGVGSLIMKYLQKLTFDIARLHTLKAEVIETNERAIDFYKKSGFSEEGRLKELVFKDGRWQDVIIMGIVNVS